MDSRKFSAPPRTPTITQEKLRRLEERYWNEDLSIEERCELEDIIRKLWRLHRRAES